MELLDAIGALVLLLWFFGMSVILTYPFLKKLFLSWQIRNLPTSKTRSAAVGLVELSGKATDLKTLISPITKTKCVYWRVICEYNGRHNWIQFHTSESQEPFFLEDSTGKILVDHSNADMAINNKSIFTGYLTDFNFLGKRKAIDPKALNYLNANTSIKAKMKDRSLQDIDEYRVTELSILENGSLYVLGNAEPNNLLSCPTSNNLVVRKNPTTNFMYISDDIEQGILNKMRWPILEVLATLFIYIVMLTFLIVMIFVSEFY